MRVLVVEDDDINRQLMASMLERDNHEVVTASDGEEGLRKLKEHAIRMVVLDWMMPVMDGLEFCRHLRSAGLPWYTYVILVTARRDANSVVEGLSAGADEFLTKPFDPPELAVRVATGKRILALETRHVAIFALAKLAESRDPETGEHLERIREYTRLIATAMRKGDRYSRILTSEYISDLYLTSPLHDIGKVGIPDYILLKPGRLSDEEFQVMKRHSVIGGQTLEGAARECSGVAYLRSAADIAMYHHERFDGKGYPKGLKGDDIPLCARIVGLADVYDAITSKRVYKAACDHDLARGIIVEDCGKHFDPDVVQGFLDSEESFKKIAARHRDPSEKAETLVGAET